MIYGLIIYFNPETARAFELGEQGKSREEVRETLEGERRAGYRMRYEERDRGMRYEERDRGDGPEAPPPPPPTGPSPHIR